MNRVKKTDDIRTKLNLLSKSTWTYQDIMSYFNCSQRTASNIKKDAIENYDGKVKWFDQKVKTDSVLASVGENNRSIELGLMAKALAIKEFTRNENYQN